MNRIYGDLSQVLHQIKRTMTQKRQVLITHDSGRALRPSFLAQPTEGSALQAEEGKRVLAHQETTVHIEGVYIISVAARILEMHPQTLRKYERAGLVRPSRTLGMLRLYSDQDIARLRLIKHLVDDVGMNLAGVEFVLQMFNRLLEARNLLSAMQAEDFTEDMRLDLQRLLDLLEADPNSNAPDT